MIADSDYGRVLDLLAHQRLPAFVSYVDAVALRGVPDEGNAHGPRRITVDTRTKTILEGTPSHIDTGRRASRDTNPVTAPAFDPTCYRATNETRATYNGRDAVLFTLLPTCGSHDDYIFSALYADAQTFAPLAATGTVSDSEGGGGAHADVEQRFAIFGGYVMPSLLSVNVKGTGIVFWLRVHVEESYTAYEFDNTRRQSH